MCVGNVCRSDSWRATRLDTYSIPCAPSSYSNRSTRRTTAWVSTDMSDMFLWGWPAARNECFSCAHGWQPWQPKPWECTWRQVGSGMPTLEVQGLVPFGWWMPDTWTFFFFELIHAKTGSIFFWILDTIDLDSLNVWFWGSDSCSVTASVCNSQGKFAHPEHKCGAGLTKKAPQLEQNQCFRVDVLLHFSKWIPCKLAGLGGREGQDTH